jgi:hypothetical protein
VKRFMAPCTLALLIGVGLLSSSVSNPAMTASASSSQNDPQRIDREFRATMGQKLVFDLKTGGSVDVVGWDRELVSVEVYKGGSDAADCRIDFDETSNGITITSEYVGRRHGYSTNFSFVVRVPRRFDLEFDSTGGGISICGVEGRISGKTMGGSLTLNNLKGDIRLMTMGGAVTLSNSELNGTVETMGGGVLIENVSGNVRGTTMGGDVVRRNNGGRRGRASEDCATGERRGAV